MATDPGIDQPLLLVGRDARHLQLVAVNLQGHAAPLVAGEPGLDCITFAPRFQSLIKAQLLTLLIHPQHSQHYLVNENVDLLIDADQVNVLYRCLRHFDDAIRQ